MVSLIKKKIGKKTVYYLKHNIRRGNKYKTIEKYLGSNLPKDLEMQMLNFFREIHKEKYKEIEFITKRIKGRKLPKSVQEKSLKEFGIRFTYNTNKIEGSTLSLRDTYNILEMNISPENKSLSDVKEAESHYKVFVKMMKTEKINLQKILEWHYEIFKDTKPDIAGVTGSKFIPPSHLELNALIKDFFKWLNKNMRRYEPVDLAGLAHLKFVTIHPFGDGNGRISRLIMNWVLFKKRHPMFIIEYKNRKEYYSALKKAQIKENPFIFLGWFIKNYLNFLRKEYKCRL